MKLTATLLLSALIAAAYPFIATGQPVLTAATSVPTAGTNVRMLSSATVTGSAAGAGGTNRQWDISAISFNKRTDTLSYRACTATDDCGRYSGTTVLSAHPQVNGLATDYYIATVTVLSRRGNKDSVGGQSFHHIYTNPLEVLHFPMSYQSAFVDSFAVFDTATNGSPNSYRRGVDTVLADGWGSLKTPSGSFANTLRIKETIRLQDSTRDNLGHPSVTRTAYTTYSWYDAAHPYPLAQSAEYDFGPGAAGSIVTYADVPSNATGVAAVQPSVPVAIAPNPAHSLVTLTLVPSVAGLSVTITDMTGRSVYQAGAVNSALMLDVQGWAPGIYAVMVKADHVTTMQKLVIR